MQFPVILAKDRKERPEITKPLELPSPEVDPWCHCCFADRQVARGLRSLFLLPSRRLAAKGREGHANTKEEQEYRGKTRQTPKAKLKVESIAFSAGLESTAQGETKSQF